MEEKKSPVGMIILIIVLIALGGWAISKRKAAAPKVEGPVKVGFIGPLTGDVSSMGIVSRRAVELAIKEINDAGGIGGQPVEAVYEDGKCDAEAATTAANKLINIDKVNVIVGGLCSTETSAFVQIAMQAKVPTISYASSVPTLTGVGKYFFRDFPSDAFQGKFAAEYAYNTLGKKKVAVLYHISDWGTGLKNVFVSRFKELGGEIVAEEGLPQDSRDYRTALTKIKSTNPELVYMPLYSEGGIVALQQLTSLGIKSVLLGGEAFGDTNLWKEASKVANGKVMYTTTEAVTADDFKQKMEVYSKEGDITVGAPQAYDAMKIFAQAISKVGLDPDKIAAELHNVQNYQGASGSVSFDANGDLTTANYAVKVIKDGKAEIVQ